MKYKTPMENAIAVLRQSVEYATLFENKLINTNYKTYLANARSILNFWDNPPKGKNFFATYTTDEIYRIQWNLERSMETE